MQQLPHATAIIDRPNDRDTMWGLRPNMLGNVGCLIIRIVTLVGSCTFSSFDVVLIRDGFQAQRARLRYPSFSGLTKRTGIKIVG